MFDDKGDWFFEPEYIGDSVAVNVNNIWTAENFGEDFVLVIF